MNNVDPKLKVNCPLGSIEANSLAMALPGAVAGAYYVGATGSVYGAIESVCSGRSIAVSRVTVAGSVKGLLAGKATVIAKRSIWPCVVEAVLTGFEWAHAGGFSGALCFGGIGACSPIYQDITGYTIPDIEMDLSITAPRVQLIERA